jgi:SSS family solute:Na+ symporter
MTLAIVGLYLALVLAIGLFGQRLLRGTGEDFFAATRSIGPFVLLMSLFGTHMTAFSILGASGEAYHRGVGVFSLMASSSAVVVPAVFLFIGTRVWALGKRHGYLTQVELFRERWDSEGLGLLLFVVLVALLVPYVLIGVLGGGVTLAEITGGQVPQWLGSLAISAVVLVYVAAGGVRSTAWVNTFQTLVFMTLGAATFAVIAGRSGGLGAALAGVDPALLHHGDRVPPLELLTYAAIPLSVAMFPHMFTHWLTARRAAAFRPTIVAYPLCLAVVWVPSVLLGVLGSAQVPGLAGPAANGVLIRLIGLHAPEVLAGLLAAGVCAALMSSLDSQVLALSTLFTRDVVGRWGRGRRGRALGGRGEVLAGRLFVVAIVGVAYVLSLATDRSIFRLGVWSFTGFAALFPLAVAALFWRRSTAAGATASVATAAGLWIFFYVRAGEDPSYTVGGTGVMPVAAILAAAAAVLVAVSLATRPPRAEVLARFFPPAAGAAPAVDPAAAAAARAPAAGIEAGGA